MCYHRVLDCTSQMRRRRIIVFTKRNQIFKSEVVKVNKIIVKMDISMFFYASSSESEEEYNLNIIRKKIRASSDPLSLPEAS